MILLKLLSIKMNHILLLVKNCRLYKKVNERVLELQNLFEKDFLDSLSKINKIEQYVIDLKKENNYYINLIRVLLQHNETSNILGLSK